MAHFASNPNLTQGLGVQFRDVPCTVAAYPNIDLIEQRTVCGAPDELVELQSQPAGVLVNLGSWTGTERVVSFSPAEGYTLVGTTSFTFTESGPCVTEPPVPPVQTEVCGTNNDAIGFPSDQPANVLVTQSEGWSQDSSWTVTFAAAEGYVLPVDTETQYILMDPGPCETSAPVSPVQTEVCGTNNDIISFPSDQPANVLVTQSDGWSPEGSWTVIFSAAEHHKLPVGTQTDYVFTDTAIPCPADSPAPPVQSAVCGPGNDLITIPVDQPTGISLASDSGWQKNIRTITFAVAPDFQTDGPTTFTFTDAADPCSIPTVQVTIQLQTEDGGSIEGSSW